MTYTKHQLIVGAVLVMLLLGVGCRKQSPAPASAPPPAAEAPADPLADDLDAAIEDLDALEE